jgi:hypothetical protein
VNNAAAFLPLGCFAPRNRRRGRADPDGMARVPDRTRSGSDEHVQLSDRIEHVILVLRGQKVLLDADLATLYGVETKALNQAVRRNLDRFPADFMFQLTPEEGASLRSQFVTLKAGQGQHRKYLPYVFTEQGVAMLSTVLRSPRAIAVNIEIMRAFVRLRRLLSTHRQLAEKLEALEQKYDAKFRVVFDAIRELMAPPPEGKRPIGFRLDQRS